MNNLTTFSTLFCLLSIQSIAVAELPFAREQTFCVAALRSEDENAQINLRSLPSQRNKIIGYGLPGDLVYLLGKRPPEPDIAHDERGKIWQRVGFPTSRVTGWIRQDFLTKYCSSND